MKLLLLAVGAATIASASSAAVRPTSALPPLVVFVHGRNQLGADTSDLRRRWEAELDSGLAAAGESPLRPADVRLAWYADVLDPESDADCATTSNDSVSVGLGEFSRGLLSVITAVDSTQNTHDVRSALSDVFYVMDPGKRCAAPSQPAAPKW